MPNHDPPFKLPLKKSLLDGHVMLGADGRPTIDQGTSLELVMARRDRIILCVNAHDKLVAVAEAYKADLLSMELDEGFILKASVVSARRATINDALALAEPPRESEKLEQAIADDCTD